ncbi:hypothetical protein V7152_29215, partial [Neobacillus drentensis]
MSRKGNFLGNFLFCLNQKIDFYYKLLMLLGLLISAPGASLSAGGFGEPPRRFAPAGSPLSRTP